MAIQHEDKCRWWNDEEFCDCGALEVDRLESQVRELQAEVARLTAELDSRIIGNRDAQEVISRQAGMLADLRAEITRLQPSLTLSREEGRREGMVRAAEIADDDTMRDWIGGSTGNAIGTAKKIAAAIRSEAKGERG